MNQARFLLKKATLKGELLKIKKAYKTKAKLYPGGILELTITDGLLTMVVPGIKIEVPCTTVGTAKASLNVFYFYDIVSTWTELSLECILVENEMQVGSTRFKIQTTFFTNDRILRSIRLPINYTDFHLLQLQHKGYTEEELRFNDLVVEIIHAERRLTNNITKAKEILGVYGFTTTEIKELIEHKIR